MSLGNNPLARHKSLTLEELLLREHPLGLCAGHAHFIMTHFYASTQASMVKPFAPYRNCR